MDARNKSVEQSGDVSSSQRSPYRERLGSEGARLQAAPLSEGRKSPRPPHLLFEMRATHQSSETTKVKVEEESPRVDQLGLK